MKLLTVESMKQLETAANEGGYTFEKMMTKAGENLAKTIHERYWSDSQNQILGLVGGGNNGGDTVIALTELLKLGWHSTAVLLKRGSQPDVLLEQYRKFGGKLMEIETVESSLLMDEITQARIVVDGVIGTGFTLPMRSPTKEIIKLIGSKCGGKTIVAVDCPSGIDCITGDVSEDSLKADLTVCMDSVKTGLLKFPAFEYCGEILTVDLGIPAKFQKELNFDDAMIDAAMVKQFLPKRENNSHKGTFGRVIVCGGCVNYAGAPILASKSAYRVGAGLVECAVPERVYEVTAGSNLESIWLMLEGEDGVIAEAGASTLMPRLENAGCLLLGPGIGREESTLKFFNRILFEPFSKPQSATIGFLPNNVHKTADKRSQFPPLVIDADGLWLLSKTSDWNKKLPALSVLTPHPGEMAALTGLAVDEIQKDRMEVARKFATEWGQVVVLKGALTVVASPEGKIAVLPFANAMLAKAGTGDVLAGMIAGLISQGMPLYLAATAGVWLHARAGVIAAKELGSECSIIASDLITAIPGSFNSL